MGRIFREPDGLGDQLEDLDVVGQDVGGLGTGIVDDLLCPGQDVFSNRPKNVFEFVALGIFLGNQEVRHRGPSLNVPSNGQV